MASSFSETFNRDCVTDQKFFYMHYKGGRLMASQVSGLKQFNLSQMNPDVDEDRVEVFFMQKDLERRIQRVEQYIKYPSELSTLSATLEKLKYIDALQKILVSLKEQAASCHAFLHGTK